MTLFVAIALLVLFNAECFFRQGAGSGRGPSPHRGRPQVLLSLSVYRWQSGCLSWNSRVATTIRRSWRSPGRCTGFGLPSSAWSLQWTSHWPFQVLLGLPCNVCVVFLSFPVFRCCGCVFAFCVGLLWPFLLLCPYFILVFGLLSGCAALSVALCLRAPVLFFWFPGGRTVFWSTQANLLMGACFFAIPGASINAWWPWQEAGSRWLWQEVGSVVTWASWLRDGLPTVCQELRDGCSAGRSGQLFKCSISVLVIVGSSMSLFVGGKRAVFFFNAVCFFSGKMQAAGAVLHLIVSDREFYLPYRWQSCCLSWNSRVATTIRRSWRSPGRCTGFGLPSSAWSLQWTSHWPFRVHLGLPCNVNVVPVSVSRLLVFTSLIIQRSRYY